MQQGCLNTVLGSNVVSLFCIGMEVAEHGIRGLITIVHMVYSMRSQESSIYRDIREQAICASLGMSNIPISACS